MDSCIVDLEATMNRLNGMNGDVYENYDAPLSVHSKCSGIFVKISRVYILCKCFNCARALKRYKSANAHIYLPNFQ